MEKNVRTCKREGPEQSYSGWSDCLATGPPELNLQHPKWSSKPTGLIPEWEPD